MSKKKESEIVEHLLNILKNQKGYQIKKQGKLITITNI